MSSKIHVLVRGCFAVAAIILLHADGSHSSVDPSETTDDHTSIQRSHSDRAHVPSSKVIDEHWGMVKTKGSQFVGDRPFYFNGFNTYWLMMHAVDPSTRGKVTQVFQQAAAVGMSVCRTWAFNDGGYMALQKSPSVYDEDVFKALDFVLSQARKYRIRLILSLINNWDDYGGKGQYVKWARDAGVKITSKDDFFSDQTVKGYFKNNVKNMLTRVNTYTNVIYKDDPTIFAWELMNELRCASDPTGNKLQAWIQEMAFHVKSIDPYHLLENGAEGFYGPPSPPARLQTNPHPNYGKLGTDFFRNHHVQGIDFASVHVYPDIWLSSAKMEAQLNFVRSWMQAHITDAEGSLGMPVEFGLSTKTASAFNATSREQFIQAVYGELLGSMSRCGAGAGGLLWQVFPEGTDNMDDGYSVVLPSARTTANIMLAHSKKLQIINARCG